MDHAYELLGPIQKPYSYQLVSESDLATLGCAAGNRWGSSAGDFVAELDIEETLTQWSELMYQVRMPVHRGLVLLLDTSLSMKGEKLAFLAVTVAAVALSVPNETLAVLGFDSETHTIKPFCDPNGQVLDWISNVMRIPPGGFTHIERGLTAARKWIEDSPFPQARIILVSDGRYTEGKDPVRVAAGQSFIHAIKIGKEPQGRSVMRAIADQTGGHFHEVREMRDLPQVLLAAIRSWVR